LKSWMMPMIAKGDTGVVDTTPGVPTMVPPACAHAPCIAPSIPASTMAASFALIGLSITRRLGKKLKSIGERMVKATAPQRASASAVNANVSRASSKGLVRLSQTTRLP
jgi:hypothetical protein